MTHTVNSEVILFTNLKYIVELSHTLDLIGRIKIR